MSSRVVAVVDAEGSTAAGVDRARPGWLVRTPWLALVVLTAVVWIGLAGLAAAFLRTSLDWTYVAEQSRVGAPWYYRLAGVWGGMQGSLLLFTAIVAVALAIATRRASVPVQVAAGCTVATLAITNLAVASPFGQQRVPSTMGFGLNPILEHPAMAIHPPLLYCGLAASAGAAAAATRGADAWRHARAWLLACLTALTAAMTLGGAWSYVEQGWGGYWAWDPVENTSLLVWLAALLAVHVAPRSRSVAGVAVCLVPWVLTLAGSALTRSGRTPSVHAFGEQAAIGWVLLALTVATLAVAAAQAVIAGRPPQHSSSADPRRVTAVLTVVALVVVIAGTVWPVLADLNGGRAAAVRGEFFSRTVGPLALAAVPFLVMRLRRPIGWSLVAHAGMLVLLAGVGASTFDRSATDPVADGEQVTVAGVDVRNDGLEIGPGSRAGTEAVTAALDIDGHAYRPSIVVYPERGGRLAEISVRTGPWTDTHAVLEGAQDDGTVLLTVHQRHGMWLVWIGAATVTVATIALATRRRTGELG